MKKGKVYKKILIFLFVFIMEKIVNSKDNYKCFAIEDYDGNKIEIAYYNK